MSELTVCHDIPCPDVEAPYNSIEIDGLCQWQITSEGIFIPCTKTVRNIPPGLYSLICDRNGNICLKTQTICNDQLLIFPDKQHQEIIGDIKKFWQRKEFYVKYNFSHKRGILLYGEPGCGKSCIVNICIQFLISKLNGIVLNISNADELEFFEEIVPTIRKIEQTVPIIVIIEDIDGIANSSNHITSTLLNLLDGIKQIQNVVYIATTNYPQELEQRLSNRPSRFDRRYEITLPSKTVRQFYFQKKIKPEQLAKIDLNKWILQTQGFSTAHLKELIISVFVLNYQFEQAIKILKSMIKQPTIKCEKLNTKKAGF